MPISPGGCCSCISASICARNAALKPLTLVSVSALPFSGNILQQPGLFAFHPPVWAGCSTDWDLRWHHSCSLQSGFVIVTENLVSLSRTVFIPPAVNRHLETGLEPAGFSVSGDQTEPFFMKPYQQRRKYLPSPKYWMSVGTGLHVYTNQQFVSLACHRDWKQTVFTPGNLK